MNDGLKQELIGIFDSIYFYNLRTERESPLGLATIEFCHQRTRYVQRTLRAFGIGDELLKELMEVGEQLAHERFGREYGGK